MPDEAPLQDRVSALSALLETIDRSSKDGGYRLAIFAVWRVLARAPYEEQQFYKHMPEADVLAAAASVKTEQRAFGFAVTGTESDQALVQQLAVQLRALELALTEEDLGSWPSDPNDSWRVRLDADEAFLIPIARLDWRPPPPGSPNLRGFDRRGLTRMRVVPVRIGGIDVRLYRADRGGATRARPKFGATLFPEVAFGVEFGPDSFLVTGVTIPDVETKVARSCQTAHTEECVALVFPELTIAPDVRNQIRDSLENKDWAFRDGGERTPAPSVVVAGSWHERHDDQIFNVATVFDGNGRPLLEHRKIYVFQDPDGRAEGISVGRELAILITDEGLFAFGICPRSLDYGHGMESIFRVNYPATIAGDSHLRHVKYPELMMER